MTFDVNYDFYTLYTTSPRERDDLLLKGFVSEGVAGFVLASLVPGAPDVAPLIEISLGSAGHFYAPDLQDRRDYLQPPPAVNYVGAYTLKGVVGGVSLAHGPGLVPLYWLTRFGWYGNLIMKLTCTKTTEMFAQGFTDMGAIGLVYGPSSPQPASGWVGLYEITGSYNGDLSYTTDASQAGGADPICYLPKPAPERKPFYRMWKDGEVYNSTQGNLTDHFLTTSVKEVNRAADVNYKYKLLGTAGCVFDQPGPGLVPMFRVIEPNTRVHILTQSTEERDRFIDLYGYVNGPVFYVPATEGPDTVPLFRLRRGNPMRRLPRAPRVKIASSPLLVLDPSLQIGRFSSSPSDNLLESLYKKYSGVHVEQAVPLLDRDLNLLGDLAAAKEHRVVEEYLGNGTLSDNAGFAIQPVSPTEPSDPRNNGDFVITAGRLLLGGVLFENTAAINYLQQAVPADDPLLILAPVAHAVAKDGSIPVDLVYLDAWVSEVEETSVPLPAADPGMRTSVRLKPQWRVRIVRQWTAGGWPESPPRGHIYYPLARISRYRPSAVLSDQIEDLRGRPVSLGQLDACLTLLQQKLVPTVTPPSGLLPSFSKGSSYTFQLNNMGPGEVSVTIGGISVPVGRIGAKYVIHYDEGLSLPVDTTNYIVATTNLASVVVCSFST